MRPLVPLSALIALAALVVALVPGWDDAHAREHALYALAAGAAAAVVGARWRAELPSFSAVARLALVGSAALLAAAQLAASLAVAAEGRESAAELHDLAYDTSLVALVALAGGALLALAYAASRLRTWRRHPAAR